MTILEFSNWIWLVFKFIFKYWSTKVFADSFYLNTFDGFESLNSPKWIKFVNLPTSPTTYWVDNNQNNGKILCTSTMVYHELLIHTLKQYFKYHYVRGSQILSLRTNTTFKTNLAYCTTIQCHNRGSVGASIQAAEGAPLYFSFIRAKIMRLYNFWGQFIHDSKFLGMLAHKFIAR